MGNNSGKPSQETNEYKQYINEQQRIIQQQSQQINQLSQQMQQSQQSQQFNIDNLNNLNNQEINPNSLLKQ